MVTWNIPKLNNQLPNPAKAKESAKARKRVKRAQANPPTTPPASIKVRCDARTIITIRPHMLSFWQGRYPNLTIIP
jgi:hypothetical protein